MKSLKIKNIALLLLAAVAFPAGAYEFPAGNKVGSTVGVTVENIRHEGSNLVTTLNFDFSNVKLKANSELVLTPMFVNGTDTVALEPVTVAGRNRWYYLQRNKQIHGTMVKGFGGDKGAIFGETLPKGQKQLPQAEFVRSCYWQPWMAEAFLVIEAQDRGCANCPKGPELDQPIAQNDFVTRSYAPAEFIYVTPVAEAVKMREISARAFIDFPVNQIIIYPDYRNNPAELGKIIATIDSIKNDKDITVTSLHISGTASPEGSYQNNVRLAKGRTEALKDYVQKLYKFPAGFITTSYEPVDWAGLSDYLEGKLNTGTNVPALSDANLPNHEQILAIVNSDIEPFARNTKIKATYPSQYAWLLANVYPALRHSDYKIAFEIKTYTEISEILEVMQTQPQKLSLAELFVAANSQPVGSDLYNRAFELAVTMFPDDATANLNAGNNAMVRGDLISAARYLAKAGNTPEADYARAMLLLAQGNQEEGLVQLRSLANSLNSDVASKAASAVAGIEDVNAANARTFVEL